MREPLHLQDVFMSRFRTSAPQALFIGSVLILFWLGEKRWGKWGC